MQRIAAPMVGGMITAPLLSMFVVPAAFLLLRRRELARIGAMAGRPGGPGDDDEPQASQRCQ
jgi:Cu(I)/Ag(I) efflux system membrane protein CusA/SilA